MLKLRTVLILFIISVLVSAFNTPAFCQWANQSILLRPGWNAVFFNVQPEPKKCEKIFEEVTIESVWYWNYHFSSVQFIQDAKTLMPEQPEWLTYFPPNSGKSHLNDLFTIQGGRAYLIKLNGSESVKLEVTGTPIVKPIEWKANSFNLVGFYVGTEAKPTFDDFFSPSTAHSEVLVYHLNISGTWENVVDTSKELIQPGTAYWIYCKGQSIYSGPLTVAFEQGIGINFGRILTEQTLRIKNETSFPKKITLTKKSSEDPPNVMLPSPAGGVLLSYWNPKDRLWQDLSDPLEVTLQPNSELKMPIAVNRKDMPGAVYQSLLEISDGQGSLLLLPVTATGLGSDGGNASTFAATALNDAHFRAGLWVGYAVINKVSYAADDSDKVTPRSTDSEFQMRLILHVNENGQARLLQQVILMWREGTQKPDPDDPDKNIVDEPGRFVLVTRDDLVPQFSGASIRGGKAVGRRISSAAFGFSEPLPMSGSFDGTLVCNGITLDFNHPLNPFKHKYHPDHDNFDNLAADFSSPLSEGKESYTITRNITLIFTAADLEGIDDPGWGDNQAGGIYRENIEGVHKEKIYLEGIFRLHHASRIALLNDGL